MGQGESVRFVGPLYEGERVSLEGEKVYSPLRLLLFLLPPLAVATARLALLAILVLEPLVLGVVSPVRLIPLGGATARVRLPAGAGLVLVLIRLAGRLQDNLDL